MSDPFAADFNLNETIKSTVNPLYNVIRYNRKFVITSIRSVQKSACIFFIDSPMLFFRNTYVFDICKNRLAQGILKNTKKTYDSLKNVQKYPLFMV